MADDNILQLDEGTYLKSGGSIRTWEYFSRYTVAADTVRTKIFTAKLGDTGFTRDDQTNMPAPGRIPNSQRFDVGAVSVGYVGGAAKADANVIAVSKWLFTTIIRFSIQDKVDLFQKRLSSILGIGLFLFNDPTTAAEPVTHTLRTDVSKAFILRRPIKLASNTDFFVEVIPGVAAAAQQVTDGDFLDVGLHGDLWSRV